MSCDRCGGTGWITVYDWVPYGDTNVRMETAEDCPECLGRGICPRCGEEMDYEVVDQSAECDRCGYKLFKEGAR
jgi:hypothetical protein